jgi:excisionase family DNA binding protein
MADELSPSQAAARIGTTTRTVQRWIVAGTLPARRVGGRWRVASDALDAFRQSSDDAAGQPGVAPARIRTLFIANRGEIAARIRRTATRLGVEAVSALDTDPTLDLLDAPAVVEAARRAGVDALHPGYGFLAENADFAEAVEAAGIIWVGPPPAAVRAMGDKAQARRLARQIGVPVLPGYDDADQSDAALDRAAREVGVPLLVKPAAGGGGKGMRVVRDLARLADAIAASRREARTAFGDDRLILERYLDGPRHVEIQVLFDRHGAGVHLGERDCSIQRRHQKILEETPSPAASPALRSAMGEAALRLASAVGYASAGTCEFLLDDRGEFYFLEMNTRLQVEHPVTELVTSRDLVADQLRIAAGDPLGTQQSDVRLEGHAVEVRLYAEDAEAGFLPATGRVERVAWPTGDGIRVDAGIEAGTDVSEHFDPMLAKIVAHGASRREALARLRGALDETLVLGLTTNLRFLRWLVREPVVLEGQARIDTLDRIWPPDDWETRVAITDAAWRLAGSLLMDDSGGQDRPDPWRGGWRVNAPARVRLSAEGGQRSVDVDPSLVADVAFARAENIVHLDLAGRSVPFRIAPPPDVDRAARAAAGHAGTGSMDVTAAMPGAVLAVHVSPGHAVEGGDALVTLEAMKMEHVVAAPVAGTVTELLVQPGDQVTRGQLLGVVGSAVEALRSEEHQRAGDQGER